MKTKEENKMEWIEYNGQELQNYRNYLVCFANGNIDVWEFNCRLAENKNDWKQVIAFQGLPKPYEKPKSLKERLDEAVEKYCYKFSDEEWKDVYSKYFIIYDYETNEFEHNYTIDTWCSFYPFSFETKENTQSFIDSFTTDELMKIMKGEVK